MPSPTRLLASVALLVAPFLLPPPAVALRWAARPDRSAAPIRFRDAGSQTAQFIGYTRSITLTPEQQERKNRVLGSIPAPCCKDYSVATCCCPCNLAKSVWGLSNYLIAKKNMTDAELTRSVKGWLRFINAKGFSGDVCYSSGGCSRPFTANGCGGMDEKKLVISGDEKD